MAMDFSWLPPGTDVNRLPLGMRVNNPSNIKYFKGLNYPGMLGPSSPGHTDQGDPQMTFDTPQSGMNAAASLAWKKYQGGKRSPNALIAGNMGWTPGNTAAAANVARTMGIDPNADMNLSDPKQMSAFLRALTAQEHGPASKLYGDDVYQSAATSAVNGQAMPVGSNLSRQLGGGVSGYVGGTAAAPAQQPAALPVEALIPPSGRYSKLADALMMKAAGAKPGGWGEALNALGSAALGYSLGDKADKQENAYRSKLAQALGGASSPDAMVNTLIASGDPTLQKAGVELKVKAQQPKSQIGRFRPTKQGVVDTTTGQIVPGTEAMGADQAEYGTSPQYYKDKDGNLRLGQLSKAGGMKPVEFPEGATVLPGVDYKDVGTEIIGRDKRTGEIVSAQPKDIVGKESLEEVGKDRGAAQIALPTVEDTTNRLLDRLDRLETSPMRKSFTGYSGYLPNVTPEANDYQGLLDEVQGNTFLQAFQNLRGGGAITEIEGQKATAALTRLQNLAPSDAGYGIALQDARNVFKEIRNNVRRRAGQAPTQAPEVAPNPNAAPAAQPGGAPRQIQSQEEYQALPPGTQYLAPDGSLRTKQ